MVKAVLTGMIWGLVATTGFLMAVSLMVPLPESDPSRDAAPAETAPVETGPDATTPEATSPDEIAPEDDQSRADPVQDDAPDTPQPDEQEDAAAQVAPDGDAPQQESGPTVAVTPDAATDSDAAEMPEAPAGPGPDAPATGPETATESPQADGQGEMVADWAGDGAMPPRMSADTRLAEPDTRDRAPRVAAPASLPRAGAVGAASDEPGEDRRETQPGSASDPARTAVPGPLVVNDRADPAPSGDALPPDRPTHSAQVEGAVEPSQIAALPVLPAPDPDGEAPVTPSGAALGPDSARDRADGLPEVAPAPEPPLPRPGFSAEVPGVRVGRLPAIGAEPETEPQEEAEAEPEVDTEDLPAVRRYAAAFDPPEDRARFAVILIDDGLDGEGRQTLTTLPFPVSVALDPTRPDAAAAAADYRAAGLELLMLASEIPAGATASDLEVTFSSHFSILPQVVGVLDLPEDGFQGNRVLAQQIVAILERDGQALITYDRGLNPAAQTAQSAGLANGTVFRLLDAGEENAPTIRRYLDRAAFRAAQEGRVIVLGRASHAPTMAALMEWRLEGRTDAVELSPVSAAIRMDDTF